MKRVYLAVALLVLLPAIVLLSHFYLHRTTQKMADTLESAETYARKGNEKAAEKAVAAFNGQWESNKALLSTFIRHTELDTVNLSAAKLKPFLQNDSMADFYAESDSLKIQLSHIYQSDRFCIDNIF